MTIYEELFYEALQIRLVEEKIIEVYPDDKVESPVHLSIGQEHHIVAMLKSLSTKDIVFTTYRSHAVYLAKGGNLKLMIAELYGKQDGISKGKSGSMHLCSPKHGMMGSSAIVGAIYSHSIGMAYSQKIDNSINNITICITGEGATEEGVFCETLNFASLKQLPIIYIIENNGLAINIPIEVRQSYTIEKLATAYNIEYHSYKDGFDMLTIHNKFAKLVTDMKKTPRPIIIEVNTYRYFEHVGISMDYDKGYRTLNEYKSWYQRDPLVLNETLINKYKNKILKDIDDAINFAENSPYSFKDELLKDVY